MLPKEKVEASSQSPVVQVIYGPPKVGKTTLLAELDNNLIIDCEGGTKMIDALKINCIGLQPPLQKDRKGQYIKDENGRPKLVETPEQIQQRHDSGDYYFHEIGVAILREQKETGKLPYDFVTIDTITKLEEWAEQLATEKYKNTLQGKTFSGDTILDLPHGGGYRLLRNEYKYWIEKSEKLADYIILCGHLREKIISYDDRSVSADDLDLTGKVRNITCQNADAIGYIAREEDPEDKNIRHAKISYVTEDAINCGVRAPHLAGQTFRLGTSEYNGEYFELKETHWNKIYKHLNN